MPIVVLAQPMALPATHLSINNALQQAVVFAGLGARYDCCTSMMHGMCHRVGIYATVLMANPALRKWPRLPSYFMALQIVFLKIQYEIM